MSSQLKTDGQTQEALGDRSLSSVLTSPPTEGLWGPVPFLYRYLHICPVLLPVVSIVGTAQPQSRAAFRDGANECTCYKVVLIADASPMGSHHHFLPFFCFETLTSAGEGPGPSVDGCRRLCSFPDYLALVGCGLSPACALSAGSVKPLVWFLKASLVKTR